MASFAVESVALPINGQRYARGEREREGEGENLDKFRIYIWRIFYGEWRED